jgi:Na+-transporting NADH:ubiquinone oxidoreductase subunit C
VFASGGLEVKGSVYTLVYAAVLGTVCAAVLTFAATFTAPYQEANRKAEEALNILLALNVPGAAEATAEEVLTLRDDNVQEKEVERGEMKIMTYVYSPGGAGAAPESVAIRFAGAGLWGPIKGFLAMDPGMTRILAITFYEQEETPGLGGEITKDWFLARFKGLSLRDTDGKVGIIIGAGEASPNRVDGISGATMTCDKVEEMLNEAITSIVKE